MRAHDLEAAVKQPPLCFQASAALPCAVNNITHSPVIAWLTLEGGPVARPAAPAAPVGAPQQFFRFLSQAWIAHGNRCQLLLQISCLSKLEAVRTDMGSFVLVSSSLSLSSFASHLAFFPGCQPYCPETLHLLRCILCLPGVILNASLRYIHLHNNSSS